MIKQLSFLVGFVLILTACQEAEERKNPNLISKTHATLLGTWQEKDSTEAIFWTFDRYEVNWKGFSHFYDFSGDSLVISGLVYRILEQSDKKMKIMKLDGKECTLIRKD
mgnify:CR=1 FL=1